jgi:hypothetical protein
MVHDVTPSELMPFRSTWHFGTGELAVQTLALVRVPT